MSVRVEEAGTGGEWRSGGKPLGRGERAEVVGGMSKACGSIPDSMRDHGIGTGALWSRGFQSGWLPHATHVHNLPGGFSSGSKCPSVPFPAAMCPQPTGANARSQPKPLVLKSYSFGVFFPWPIFAIFEQP